MYDFDKVVNRIGTGSVKWGARDTCPNPKEMLPFWIADSEFETLPEIIQAIRKRCEHPLFGYTAPQKECLEAVRDWESRRHQWEIDASWVVPSVGVVTAVSYAIQALTEVGDKILLFSPIYDPFFKVINNTKRSLVDLKMVRNGDAYALDFEKLEKELADGVKALILCNPHNPVGKVWSAEDLKKIACLCKKYNVYILSDDIHADITLFGNVYTPIGKFQEVEDLVVTFTAISKTFNVAGLKSSTLIIPNQDVRSKVVGALRGAWIMGPDALALTAIESAYKNGDAYVDEMNAYLAGNVTFVTDFFAENMPDVRVTKQEGTFLMWLDFNCLGLTCSQLSDIMAKEHNVTLSEGIHYGSQADGFMRLNIGCSRSLLGRGVAAINELYKNRRKVKL